MTFDCSHCTRIYTTKYNLKRHLEQQHNCGGDSDHENGASDSSNETESGTSDVAADLSDESESGSHGEESTSSEGNDTYTHDDVRAILRYFRLQQQQENQFQKDE